METFGLVWLAIIVLGVLMMAGIVVGGRGRRGPSRRHQPTDGSATDAAVLGGVAASTMVPGDGGVRANDDVGGEHDDGAATPGDGSSSGGDWGGEGGGGEAGGAGTGGDTGDAGGSGGSDGGSGGGDTGGGGGGGGGGDVVA